MCVCRGGGGYHALTRQLIRTCIHTLNIHMHTHTNTHKIRLPWIEPHNENSEDQVKAAKKAEEMEKHSKKAPVTVQDEEEKERKR